MIIFVRIPTLFNIAKWVAMETMKFHITKEHLSLGKHFFLHLTGPIEPIYTHNEMSYVFNLDLITPLHTIVYPCFPSFLRFH